MRKLEESGFTMVEMLVSVGVVVGILTVILMGQSNYTAGVSLSNLADDIGLTLAQAQVYGVSVKEFGTGSNEFDAAYGLSFDLTSAGSNDAYIFFADREPRNDVYDSGWSCPLGGTSECIAKNTLNQDNTIESICALRANGNDMCNLGRVDVSFARPETNANLVFFNSNGSAIGIGNVIGAKITLSSPGGLERTVTVYSTGQISVQ